MDALTGEWRDGEAGEGRAPIPVNPGDSAIRQEVCLGGHPLGFGGEDITWPYQVAPRGRKASSTRKIKPQTSNLFLRELS